MRLIVVLSYILLVQLAIYHAGFSVLSGDGLFRALMAYEWRISPSIVTRDLGVFSLFWFPPYFWLTGAIYWLSNELTTSLKLVSYISSLLGLLVLYRLSWRLTNRRAATITVLLVGSIPFHLWLSLSMAETPLYLLLVLLGFLSFLNWIRLRNIVYLLGVSLSFLGASTLRPEGWILAGMLALYVGFLLVKQRDGRRFWLVISALLPLLFVGFWFADNWIYYGNPFHFMTAQLDHIGHKEYSSVIKWSRAFQPLFFMFVLSPLLFFTVIVGLTAKWSSGGLEIRGYIASTMLYVAALSGLFLFGFGTTSSPLRYGLVPLVLLAPFAGYLLSRGLGSTWGAKLATLSLLVVCVATHLFRSFNFPDTYRDAIAAANYIAASSGPSKPAKFQHLATEFELRYFAQELPRTDRDLLRLQSEHGALLAYSGRPGDFMSRPLRLRTRNLSDHSKEWPGKAGQAGVLAGILGKQGIDTVIVRDRSFMSLLPPAFGLVRTFGRFAILALHSQPVYPQKKRLGLIANRPYLSPGIRLAGHHYDGKLYPVNLVLHWAIDKNLDPTCAQQVWVRAVRQGDESDRFVKRIRPIFCWYDLRHSKPADVVEDYLPLDLPAGLPGGTYKISVALVSVAKNAHGSVLEPLPEEISWLDLPPTRLVFSKRSVLTDYLRGRNRDWPLLLQVLYSL